jgi:DNA-binding MarR family transcriptional regulator
MASIDVGRSSPARVFRELARIHLRAQRVEVARRGGGVTRCMILTELGGARDLSLGQLAARLKLDSGWVSRAIEQLVNDGLVLRTTDPTDRRAVVLSLTAIGRKQHRELDRVLDRHVERVFERLHPSDRPKVASALALLHEAYEAATTTDDVEPDP